MPKSIAYTYNVDKINFTKDSKLPWEELGNKITFLLQAHNN